MHDRDTTDDLIAAADAWEERQRDIGEVQALLAAGLDPFEPPVEAVEPFEDPGQELSLLDVGIVLVVDTLDDPFHGLRQALEMSVERGQLFDRLPSDGEDGHDPGREEALKPPRIGVALREELGHGPYPDDPSEPGPSGFGATHNAIAG